MLSVDWCSLKAAQYAVQHWHYSGSLPPQPHVRVGVWEDTNFIGCIIFARGANNNLYLPYGLEQTEGCELVRVALRQHQTPVSRLLRIAIKKLKSFCPGMRLVVSFADPNHGHHGGIYQASGWIYTGRTSPRKMYEDKNGKLWHSRVCSETGTTQAFRKTRRVPRPSECRMINIEGKHRYLLPLDSEIRQRILPLSQPYPKRAGSAASGTPAHQAGGSGATPTAAL